VAIVPWQRTFCCTHHWQQITRSDSQVMIDIREPAVVALPVSQYFLKSFDFGQVKGENKLK
jgi:hypothetical protein